MLYVLSIGPAAWVEFNMAPSWYKIIYTETGKVFYAPLLWLVKNSVLFQYWFAWYVNLWISGFLQ